MTEDDGVYTCSQCPKIFATRSNLKRHMENPNIHNMPYARCRDQKRWKDHSKKVSSRAETTERMRKWRAENKDKNKRNDLRCRVYRLARQKFGEEDSEEKQHFIESEIKRRLNRRMLLEKQKAAKSTIEKDELDETEYKPTTLNELPFYCAPRHKIELPSIDLQNRRPSSQSNTEPSGYPNKSQSLSPMSETATFWQEDEKRRLSSSSFHSCISNHSSSAGSNNNTSTIHQQFLENNTMALPPMQNYLPSAIHPSPLHPSNDNPL